MEYGRLRVELYQTFVGTQPYIAFAIGQHSVDHIIGKSVIPVVPDHAAVPADPDKARTRTAVYVPAAGAERKNVAEGAAVKGAQVKE